MLYAEFIGMQDDGKGGQFPLYNIMDSDGLHELHQSTVGGAKLIELGIEHIFYPGREVRP